MTHVIDCHTHIFPDHGAARIIEALRKEADNVPAYTDGTRQGLLNSMVLAGIDASIQVPVATRPDQVESINKFTIKINDPQIISFGAIHPQYKNFQAELGRLKAAGVRGVKFHPEYQDFFPDDAALFPIYETLINLGLVAFFHAGRDIAFENVHGTPAHFARLIKAHPKLKMVLAHMGGFQMWEEVKEELLGRDVYIDTSFAFGFMTDHSFLSMVDHHAPERILFGTDSPWQDQSAELDKIRSLIKDEKLLSLIIGDNARQLLKLPESEG